MPSPNVGASSFPSRHWTRGTSCVWLLLGALASSACGGSKSPPPDSAASQEQAAEPTAEPATDAPGEEAAASDATESSGDGEPAPAGDTGAAKAGDDGHRHEDEKRTTAVIADIIKKNRDKARACYDKAAKDTPRLAGDVVIHFTLDPEGKVQEATLNQERSTINLEPLTKCLVDVIKSLPFPPSSRGMETQVNYPFNFKP